MNNKTLIIIVALVIVYFLWKDQQKEEGTQTGNNTGNKKTGIKFPTNTGGKSNNATSIVDQAGTAEQKAANLTDLHNRFVATCNNYGILGNADKHPWDTTTLNQIMELSDQSLKDLNELFKQVGSYQCVYGEYYGALPKYCRRRTSLSDAIPSKNLTRARTGASKAYEFKRYAAARGC